MKSPEQKQALLPPSAEECIHLCRQYSAASMIPTIVAGSTRILYTSQGETMHIEPKSPLDYVHNPHRNGCEFCSPLPSVQYGRIPVQGTDFDVYLGPVFPQGISDRLLRQVMREMIIPPSRLDDLREYLLHIPIISPLQFGRHMILLNSVLNHSELTIEELFDVRSRPFEQAMAMSDDYREVLRGHRAEENPKFRQTASDDCGEAGQRGGTAGSLSPQQSAAADPALSRSRDLWNEEQRLCHYIREGNADNLKRYLSRENPVSALLPLAADPLRNAKDNFLLQLARIGVTAALPSGMSPDTLQRLTCLYMQECEGMGNMERVESLQMTMVLDFCSQCGMRNVPAGAPRDIAACLDYIRSHITVPVSLADLAAHIGRSESYVRKHFREDLGFSAGHFLTRCRIEEAKSLLVSTDLSLSEISNYLCFSSQSYFQNQFRRYCGVTPLTWRKQRSQSADSSGRALPR